MKTALIFATILQLFYAKTFHRCHLAQLFLHAYNFPPNEIDDWVCLARWESHYNSSAIGTLNADGSKDLGLFQISEKWWCDHNSPGKGCNIKCDDLLDDDLSDDVKCVKRIFNEHKRLSGNGFNAWVAWKSRCQGDLSEFLRGCDLKKKPNDLDAIGNDEKPPKRPFLIPGFSPGIASPFRPRKSR